MIFMIDSACVAGLLFGALFLPGVLTGELGTGLDESCFGLGRSCTFASGANLGRSESDLSVVGTELV